MDVVALLSLVVAMAAAIPGVYALARTVAQQAPGIEFLVDNEGGRRDLYRIRISNRTHGVLFLDYVEVHSPPARTVVVGPMEGDVRTVVERAVETGSMENPMKAVHLEIPVGTTKSLEARVTDQPEPPHEAPIDMQLHWSASVKRLPALDRLAIRRRSRIRLGQREVNGRRLAAGARASE